MTDTAEIADLLDRLKNAKVACVGDLMLDWFIDGEVERISPEAPIPVLRIIEERAMLGGAGNVVRNAVALGATVSFASVIGYDQAGREVTALLEREIGRTPGLLVEPSRPSTIKSRYFAGAQQILRADKETQSPLGTKAQDDLLGRCVSVVDGADVLILSDYAKGVLTPTVIEVLIARAHKSGTPVVVDPKGADYSRYRGAHLICPNRRELHEATGLPTSTDEDIVAAARHLRDACRFEHVLVTRSQDGMTLLYGDEVHHLPALAHAVFDVSGAGDTVAAALATALAVGESLPKAAELANIAASVVVGKVGTAVAHPSEIIRALEQPADAGSGKVLTADAAAERVRQWRRQGLRIGFTNGCFDLLHPGHVSLIEQARANCDRLVVGLNSDDSTRRLKGEGRPVQPEDSRSAVLASLGAVDMVVVFSDDTPLALIDTLRPDLLVKGKDYTVETVVGAEEVQSWGGEVMLADLVDGESTTNTISRIDR